MRTPSRIALLALAVAASCLLAAQDIPTRLSREQTSFNEAGPIQHPVPVSREVLKVLLQIEDVRDALRRVGDTERRDPSQLFHASEVHLHGPDEIDLIVTGVEGRMSGADNDWYWVVLSARTNPKVVLFAPCLGLDVMKSSTLGYLDIHTFWNSSSSSNSSIYHFHGKQYKLWKETWKSDLGPN